MTDYKVQDLKALEEEMRSVARGERPAPKDAGRTSFNSVEALARLLTPENRILLAAIRDRKPQSIAELADMTGRAASNVTRTLEKLKAAGLVTMERVARRKVPVARVERIVIEIDPYSGNDRLQVQ